MKELQAVINDKVKAMISDGTIEKTIETSVEKAVTSALESQFEFYGSITKQIKEAIENGLRINTKDLPFDSYNEQMLSAIKVKLGNMFHGQAYEHFLGQIDDLLKPAPTELPLDDLLKDIAAMWKTDEPWNADDLDEYMTVEIKQWEHSSRLDEDWTIKLWKKEKSFVGSASEDVRLFILGNKIRISSNHCYNPTRFDPAEAYIFKLYAAGTTITGIADCDPDELDLILKDEEF
ncbi:hypothetical protein [Maridesulfovibrio ferrireducens]|uniref:hypothetical protein n=1 Tax=Maridesulfovibrio ferrireducens TaxID=246191 RepID=UPI001A28CB21|nr:hypothetical protein [Maridesulfovibrio ferrireducens]MBI9112425.1 hypothetical protein [Maridesulfovibrio ferrireducens]